MNFSARTKNSFNFINESDVFSFHILGYFPNGFNNSFVQKVNNFKEKEPSIKEVIDFIHYLKGYSILAHPFDGLKQIYDNTTNITKYIKANLNNTILKKLAQQCKEYNLDGLEAYYEHNSIEEVQFLSDLAKTYNLKTTIGKDFHRKEDVVIPKYNDYKKTNFLF